LFPTALSYSEEPIGMNDEETNRRNIILSINALANILRQQNAPTD
jgi:hypothetical protein